MSPVIVWEHECPGQLVTQVVDGVVQVSCYIEDVPPPPPRVSDGLLVLYGFEEGAGSTIHDLSGAGAPLDLTIESTAAIEWLAGGGLSVGCPTIASSSAPAEKIIDAARGSKEITVEAWVKPAGATGNGGDGPARIITLSADYHRRNFQLGQSQALVDFRLRTTQTTLNGRPSLSTPLDALTAELTHLVFTRDASGMARIYINGEAVVSKMIEGDFSNWDEGYHLALANEFLGSRAWLGEYRLVAIYGRALSAKEVDQNFRAGSSPSQ